MDRREFLTALAALPALALSCKKSSDAGKIKLQLNWAPEPEFGGFYAARASGAFTRAGLDVDIVGGGPGSPVVQLVASGQADFGVAGASDVLIARERGADVVAIFASFQHSPQGVMVRASRNVARLEDLKDGTLALEPGLPFAQWIRKRYGFAGVTIVPYDGGVAKFLADEKLAQQCYVTSEPIAVRKKGVETKVFTSAETGFDPYENCVITSGKLLAERASVARAFVSAAREGWTAYLADPSAANADMGKLNAAMDTDTFAKAAAAQTALVKTDETDKDGLGTMKRDRWARLGEQLVELGVIKKAAAPEECFRLLG